MGEMAITLQNILGHSPDLVIKELRRAGALDGAERLSSALRIIDHTDPATIYQFVAPEAIASEIVRRKQQRLSAFRSLRNFLFILPVIVTLGALSWAFIAYQQVPAQSSNTNLFSLWQQGFGGAVVLTPSVTGIADGLLLLVASMIMVALEASTNRARRAAQHLMVMVNQVMLSALKVATDVPLASTDPARWAHAINQAARDEADNTRRALGKFERVTESFQQSQKGHQQFIEHEVRELTKGLGESIAALGTQAQQTQTSTNQLAASANAFTQTSASVAATAQDLAATVKRLEDILTQGGGEVTHEPGPNFGSSDYAIDRAQFTSYTPGRPVVTLPQTMLVYAHIEEALQAVRKDAASFGQQLGVHPQELMVPASRALIRGTVLTVVPECDGVTFEPEYDSFRWYKRWHRNEFTFTARQDLAGSQHACSITVYAGPFIIATLRVPLSFEAVVHPRRMSQLRNPWPRSIVASSSHTAMQIRPWCSHAGPHIGR